MTRTLGLRQVVTSSGVAIMASLCCIGELEQVVDGADHRPLGSDLVEATEEELAEASCMLDLAEHRLDDLLSEAVATAPAGAVELCRHGGRARSFRPTPPTGGMGLAVTCPAGSQIGGDPAAGEMRKIFVVAVSGVGARPNASFKQHCANGPTLAPTTTPISDRLSCSIGSIATTGIGHMVA